MGNIFGPPVYEYEDLDLPDMGVVSDINMQFIVDAATTIWTQQHANSNSAKTFDTHTSLQNKKQADDWAYQISRNNRTAYASAKLSEDTWLNSLRHFLKPIADWSRFYNPKNKIPHGQVSIWQTQLFDPIHFHHYINDNLAWGLYGWTVDDPSRYNDNLYYLYTQFKAIYPNQNEIHQKFSWNAPSDPKLGNDYWFDPTSQQAPVDIVIQGPDVPTIEGFGIAQFLEWLTGWNYFELFAYEYAFVLFVSLVSIAWTDFYPFFVEIGLI